MGRSPRGYASLGDRRALSNLFACGTTLTVGGGGFLAFPGQCPFLVLAVSLRRGLDVLRNSIALAKLSRGDVLLGGAVRRRANISSGPECHVCLRG